MARRATVAAAMAVGLFGLAAGAMPADAATFCAPRKILATGAPSSLTFLARSRARTAWVAKVTREPRLGPGYAQWLRSQDRRTVCRSLDTQKICIAAALPCRRIPAGLVLPAGPGGAAPVRPL